MKELSVIGHFGFGEELANGQTVKTKIVMKELEKVFSSDEIEKVDTHGGIISYIKLPFQIIKSLSKCKNIIILPAQNGLRFITPILFLSNYIFKRKTHYVVIGGWLPEFLKNKKILSSMLKNFNGIYVETNNMKTSLEKQKFDNLYVMPNFKDIRVLKPEEVYYPSGEPYKLCTFSRVMKEKGIEEAVEAIKTVNKKLGRTVYSLDIYGQVDNLQEEWFINLKKRFPEYIKYKGTVPFYKSVETLKNYYALLFPTYYEGEGFAGTLLDAMASGVPVIASNWRYNCEIVKSNINGYIVKAKDTDSLTKMLLSGTSGKWNNIRIKCLQIAMEYDPEKVIKILIDNL